MRSICLPLTILTLLMIQPHRSDALDDWVGAGKQSIELLMDCYQKQAINALESGADVATYAKALTIFCKDQIDLYTTAMVQAFRAKGQDDENIRTSVRRLYTDMNSKTLEVYRELFEQRKRQRR